MKLVIAGVTAFLAVFGLVSIRNGQTVLGFAVLAAAAGVQMWGRRTPP